MRAAIYALTLTVVIGSPVAAFGEPNLADRIGALRQLQPQCGVADVPADHDLIVVGKVDSQTAITNLAFESSGHIETDLATVDVEPGSRPVTLAIVAQRNLIWEVTGAIDRLHVIVLADERSRENGIVGMPPERVVFGDLTACGGVTWPPSASEHAAKPNAVSGFYIHVGRPPDKIIMVHDAMSVGIPSARLTLPDSKPQGVIIERNGVSGTRTTQLEYGKDGRAQIVGRASGPPRSLEDGEILEDLDNIIGGIRKLDPAQVVTRSRLQTSARIDRVLKRDR